MMSPTVQHYKQLQARQQAATPAAPAGGGSTEQGTSQGRQWEVALIAAADQGGPMAGSGAGQTSSSINSMVAVPGRVRLEVAVVQRVLQRAGILWPEQRGGSACASAATACLKCWSSSWCWPMLQEFLRSEAWL